MKTTLGEQHFEKLAMRMDAWTKQVASATIILESFSEYSNESIAEGKGFALMKPRLENSTQLNQRVKPITAVLSDFAIGTKPYDFASGIRPRKVDCVLAVWYWVGFGLALGSKKNR